MVSQKKSVDLLLTRLKWYIVFITTKTNFWEVLYYVCLLEILCWKKSEKVLKKWYCSFVAIWTTNGYIYILRHCKLVVCWIQADITVYDPPMPWTADGQWLCFHLVHPVFSFIIQCENYFCRDEIIGIIGATVSWFHIFKILILKYLRQWYVHIMVCKSANNL